MSKFVLQDDVAVTQFDWGAPACAATHPRRAANDLSGRDGRDAVAWRVARVPQHRPGRDDHRPAGKIVQYLNEDRVELGAGDSVYIDKDVVHGCRPASGDSEPPGHPRAPDGRRWRPTRRRVGRGAVELRALIRGARSWWLGG